MRAPALLAIGVSSLSALGCVQDAPSLESVAARAAVLARDIERLEDENAIESLQRIYGFYTDKQLWSEAADLFASDGTIEVGRSGVYVGKERVLAYLRSQGPEFPQEGRLFDQMQLQPVIHVAPDGDTANGRWHMFAQEAVHGEYGNWGAGVYENEYVKEGGVWKIQSLHLFTTMYTPYEDGWEKTALPEPGPVADLPADRPPTVEYEAYPAVFVAPFHYANPVMGSAASAEGCRMQPAACRGRCGAARDADVARAAHRLARGRRAAREAEFGVRLLSRAQRVGQPHRYLLARRHDRNRDARCVCGTCECAAQPEFVRRGRLQAWAACTTTCSTSP